MPPSLNYLCHKSLIASKSAVAVAGTATTATEVIALGHRLGFIDGQAAPFELRAVERLDGALRLAARATFKAELNPRDCPVNLSEITLADSTVPCAEKTPANFLLLLNKANHLHIIYYPCISSVRQCYGL